ncbi:Acylphosphatase [Aquisalimonas asiatica]|uniref:acylphosphatase n=2 Tax=Aquisalimonas asiatica TaxID=406100 RepID=A0A1H8QV81_9GAMM|nr:Acylphosphatase [Aquisalimonas asiatica]
MMVIAIYSELGLNDATESSVRQLAVDAPITSRRPSSRQRMRVLVLCTTANISFRYSRESAKVHTEGGHNNLMTMFDSDNVELIRFCVESLEYKDDLVSSIPDVDVIYNAITDPNRCERALELASGLCDLLGRPVINPPSGVLDTTRERNVERLRHADSVLLPETVRLGSLNGDIGEVIRDAASEGGLTPPFIMRASGFQNGKHAHLIHEPGELRVRVSEPTEVYLLQYHDVSYVDPRAPGSRLYPKYRAFMVDGKLYPIHFRVAEDDWKVHMPQSAPTYRKFPWLYDVASDFLENPSGHFPDGVWSALERAMQQIPLDYFGVDFAVSTDPATAGKLVVFEANAAMRSFLLDSHECVPEHEAAKVVIRATHDLFCKRAGVSPWQFSIPRGKRSPAVEHGFVDSNAPRLVRHLLIRGKVQGVGFREWFWHALYRHGLKGWVRNLNDGRAEAVISGPEDAVTWFLDHFDSPEKARIHEISVSEWQGVPPDGVSIAEDVEMPATAGSNLRGAVV